MKSAFLKDIIRNVTRHPGRFLLLLIVSALGAAFYVGIRAAAVNMRLMADEYYSETNLYDVHAAGYFTGSENPLPGGVKDAFYTFTADLFAIDSEGDLRLIRAHALPDEDDPEVNRVTLLRGRMPENAGELVTEERFMRRMNLDLGDTVVLDDPTGFIWQIDDPAVPTYLRSREFVITGTVRSPLYINPERGTSSLGDGNVECYVYLTPEAFTFPFFTSLYITGADKDAVAEALPDAYVTERMDNSVYTSFERDCDRLAAIANVFPLIFYLVAALVALTTVTRMVEEHRTLIGLYKALGYPRLAVGLKYVLYALAASGIGSVAGFSFGQIFFPRVIWGAYTTLYDMTGFRTPHHFDLTSIAAAISIGALLLVTILTVRSTLRQRPAALMRPRPPASGRRILLERAALIWKRMPFTYKMTARNLFRYKKRLLMTIVGITGCTALLMTGFGLRDSIANIGSEQYGKIFLYDLQAVTVSSDASAEQAVFESTGLDSLLWARQETVALTGSGSTEDTILTVLSDPKSPLFALRDSRTGELLTQSDDGVILTDKLASRLNLKAGDTVTVDGQYTAEVLGVCENYIDNYIYATPELYGKWMEPPVWNVFFAPLNGADGSETARQLINLPFIIRVNLNQTIKDTVADMVDVLDIVIVVLVLSAAALAFVVLLSLTNISITERERELATLKVLGFYQRELAWYIYRENLILTLLGIAAGLIGGIFMHRYIVTTIEVDMVSFARNIHPLSYLYSAVLAFTFAVIVNLFMNIRLSRINMVTSLKSVE